jgi:Transcription factor/nuclear export subunit protein 2
MLLRTASFLTHSMQHIESCQCHGRSIMPRLKHSAADAMFCANFIHRLHTLNAWGFPSIQIYDKVRPRCHLACKFLTSRTKHEMLCPTLLLQP